MNQFKIIIIVAMISFVDCNNNNDKKIVNSDKERLEFIISEKLFLSDYSEIHGFIPEEGLIPNEKIAFQIAEIVLSQIYGKEKIESEKPFSIALRNDVWIIEGHIEDGFLGGVAYMEIRKSSGEILKVIHTK